MHRTGIIDYTVDATDNAAVALEAGLRYVIDATPGIRRLRRGQGFSYRDANGKPVAAQVRDRIRCLAIPPAWTDVWICPHATGHIQATGRDVKGRKQYRYHDTWREVRDADKFSHLGAFGQSLDDLRRRIDEALTPPVEPRQQILAAVIRLLDNTLIRVGNEEYGLENESFGLTTLRCEHVERAGSRSFTLRFVGKSGVEHDVTVQDPRLARLVRRCQDLDGQDLFSYRAADGTVATVSSTDVNDLLRQWAGPEVTAKIFRTWGATAIVAEALAGTEPAETDRETEAQIVAAIDVAADQLRNTRAVCRQSYVHPAILDAHRDGELAAVWQRSRAGQRLSRGDRTVLRLLESRS